MAQPHRDGTYSFDDVDQQLSLTEPDKHNAIHGLLRWRRWRLVEHATDRVLLAACPGYPFILDVTVEYALTDHGLAARTTATNIGVSDCPYGHGQHPYLSSGAGLINACELQFTADTRITTDPQTPAPHRNRARRGHRLRLQPPPPLDDLKVDFAFTDLDKDPDGRAWVRLTGPDRATAALWVDQSYPIIELYAADTLTPLRRRTGLGTEPMNCPPNAFQSDEQVIRLEPGQTHTTRWGAQLTGSEVR